MVVPTRRGSPGGKDSAAGLKLLGGLLRLDALRPGGFTAYDLADHASVQTETARAFLNRSKGPGYAEAIPEGKAPARPDGDGRPAKLYRLRPDRRADLLQRLAELRHGLNTAANVPTPPKDELFASLELLEATLKELELLPGSPDEWHAGLAEARLELRGGEADLRALQANASTYAAEFTLRLSAAQNRLAAIERAGPSCDAWIPMPSSPRFDPVAWLVEKFGSWWGEAPVALEPVLVLLDGAPGHDAVASELLKSCHAAPVHVAAFDVTRMTAAERAQLYASLDWLRAATPLAVSDLVLTLDGGTKIAYDLAAEFRDLAQPGAWQVRARGTAADVARSDIVGLDLDALRRFYVAQSVRLFGTLPESTAAPDARCAAFATRLASALAAFAAADAAKAAPHLPFARPEQHCKRFLNAAQELIGNVVCLDTVHHSEIEQIFTGVRVDYVAEAERNLLDASTIPSRDWSSTAADDTDAALKPLRDGVGRIKLVGGLDTVHPSVKQITTDGRVNYVAAEAEHNLLDASTVPSRDRSSTPADDVRDRVHRELEELGALGEKAA